MDKRIQLIQIFFIEVKFNKATFAFNTKSQTIAESVLKFRIIASELNLFFTLDSY